VSIARFQLPLRIRFLFNFQLGHRHLGEVPRFFSVYSFFGVVFVSRADTSFVSVKRKVTVAFAR
jgi:hypothetical protein